MKPSVEVKPPLMQPSYAKWEVGNAMTTANTNRESDEATTDVQQNDIDELATYIASSPAQPGVETTWRRRTRAELQGHCKTPREVARQPEIKARTGAAVTLSNRFHRLAEERKQRFPRRKEKAVPQREARARVDARAESDGASEVESETLAGTASNAPPRRAPSEAAHASEDG